MSSASTTTRNGGTLTGEGAEKPAAFGILAAAILLYLSSRYSYLLFHSLVEITTIAIGFCIFIITWNSRRFLRNGVLTVIGIGYAFIAMMDLTHTLAYKGMAIFQGMDANEPTQLWIAARYLQAATIGVAPLFTSRAVDRRLVCAAYAAMVAGLATLIFTGRFPDCYTDREGLTSFKIVSEYLISALLIVSVYGYYRKRRHFHPAVLRLTVASIACTVLSEASFTSYVSVYDQANLFGHLAKMAAFYLIYRAILVTGFRAPFDLIFRDMKDTEKSLQQDREFLKQEVKSSNAELRSSEKRYRSLIEKVQTAIIVHAGAGRIMEGNPLAWKLLGVSGDELSGRGMESTGCHFLREDGSLLPTGEYPVALVITSGRPLKGYTVGVSVAGSGETSWLLVNAEPEFGDAGRITEIIVSFMDITRLRQTEIDQQRLNRELRTLSRCKQGLVRAEDEQALLDEICRILCEEAGYPMVLVSCGDSEAEAGLRSFARSGSGVSAAAAAVDWGDVARTLAVIGPEGCECLQDLAAAAGVPWRDLAIRQGYGSCISLPVKGRQQQSFGVLRIFAAIPQAFTGSEIRLLEELADDLAFGIAALRARRERALAEEALRLSDSKLREAQRIGHLGYWDLDFAAAGATLSEEACRIFRLPPPGENMGLDEWRRCWLQLVHPEDRPRVAKAYADALSGKARYDLEYRVVHGGGDERTIQSSAEVTWDDAGRPGRMVGVMQDITEIKKAVELLNRLNEELELRVRERTGELQASQQALINIVEDLNLKTAELEMANSRLLELDRLKSMFIASMSHELRTPLNSIIGFSSIIRNGWIGPVTMEQQENLNIINRAGKHLLNLINDVIDVSKIEAGKIDVRIESFDLYELLTEAVQYVEKDMQDKGLALKLEIIHLEMATDRRRLMQCVINLLSNACKFTLKGEVAVIATATGKAATDGGNVAIVVSDTGIGIEERHISSIFKPFVRLDSHLRASVPGTGLGLYLTRKLAHEVLHGTIECHSVAGQGSTFTLIIPEKLNEEGTGSRG